jgi:hypothetical protein
MKITHCEVISPDYICIDFTNKVYLHAYYISDFSLKKRTKKKRKKKAPTPVTTITGSIRLSNKQVISTCECHMHAA